MAAYEKHLTFGIPTALPAPNGFTHHFLHPVKAWMLAFSAAFADAPFFTNPDSDLANRSRFSSIRSFLTLPSRSYAKFFSHRRLSRHTIPESFTRMNRFAGRGHLASDGKKG